MLTTIQAEIHALAVKFTENSKRSELDMISVLQMAEEERVHKSFDCADIFTYAVEVLKHSPPQVSVWQAVGKKAKEIPPLGESLRQNKITVALASRLLSTITTENANAVLAFAETHTWREVERFVAGKNPKSKFRNQVKFVTGELVKMVTYVPLAEYEEFQRVQNLLGHGTKDLPKTQAALVQTFLRYKDPVRKAERAAKRAAPKEKVCAHRTGKRQPESAAQKHAVNGRDKGKCTYIKINGERCNSERWVAHHHVINRQHGGGNEPENLTTLCAHHHDLVHQMTLPGLEQEWPFDRLN